VIPATLTAAAAYAATGYLATTTADRLLTLAVAAIGATASIVAAWIARGARRDVNARRVVVTKGDNEVKITNEDLDDGC
jgi:hypothetical protein